MQLEPAATSGLAVQPDGTLTGSFKIQKDGYYHVELEGPRGEKVAASPKYTIDVIEDRAPTVSFEKPKRDTSANPVEEVFVQARADRTTSACSSSTSSTRSTAAPRRP